MRIERFRCQMSSRSTTSGSGDTWCERRFSDSIDPVAIVAAQSLRRQLLATACIDALECERCVQALEERVAWVSCATVVAPAAGWMTPRRLKLENPGSDTQTYSSSTENAPWCSARSWLGQVEARAFRSAPSSLRLAPRTRAFCARPRSAWLLDLCRTPQAPDQPLQSLLVVLFEIAFSSVQLTERVPCHEPHHQHLRQLA